MNVISIDELLIELDKEIADYWEQSKDPDANTVVLTSLAWGVASLQKFKSRMKDLKV